METCRISPFLRGVFLPRLRVNIKAQRLCWLDNSSFRSLSMASFLSGLLSLVILALDIWAIINVVKSRAETGMKVLWVLLIVFLPVLGLIIWALAGPRGNVRI